MSYTRVVALAPLPYSEDGYTEKRAERGEEFDCPEALVDGLLLAKKVQIVHARPTPPSDPNEGNKGKGGAGDVDPDANQDPDKDDQAGEKSSDAPNDGDGDAGSDGQDGEPDAKEDDRAAVEIPEDWESLKWFARRSIATKLAGKPIQDPEAANTVISAELERRAAGG